MFHLPTPVLLIFGLVLATCVIAYWSDNLGKKLGKKRITLFGLRPRQTATLISMASSVGIMLFTLAVLMIFSDQVRDAVFRVDQLRSENRQLEATSNELKASVARSQEQARAAERRARDATYAANEATTSANKRVRAVQQKIDEAEVRLRGARLQLERAVSARRVALSGQARAVAGEKRARGEAARVAAMLNRARSVLADAREQYNVVQTRLKESESSLKRSESNLAKSLSANKELTEESKKLIDDLASRRREVQALQAELKTLDERIVEANAVIAELDRQAQQAATGTVVVDIGQVFAEVVVPPRVEASRLRSTLRRLLEAGSQAAIRLGGQAYENPDTGIIRALHLASFTLPDNQGTIDETALLDHFVNYLSTLNVPVSARLVSVQRYARNREPGRAAQPFQFQARLEAVPVNRVYVQGETVAVAVIDGSQRDTVIFNALIKLVNAGGAAAREKGVTPLLSESVPEFFAKDTNEQIFDTLRALQAQGKAMQVRMVAAEDIYSVDPMTIRFVLESDAE